MAGGLLETFLYHRLKYQQKYLHDKKCISTDKGKVLTINTHIFYMFIVLHAYYRLECCKLLP